jgi:hypothetical protein
VQQGEKSDGKKCVICDNHCKLGDRVRRENVTSAKTGYGLFENQNEE